MNKILITSSIMGLLAFNSTCFSANIFRNLKHVCPSHESVKQVQENNKEDKFYHPFDDNLSWHVTNYKGGFADKLVLSESSASLSNTKLEIICYYKVKTVGNYPQEPVILTFSIPKIAKIR